MASGMFEAGVQSIMMGNIDLVNDPITALLVTSAFSPAFESDEFQSDIPDAAFVDEASIPARSVLGGVFNGDPVTFTRAASGAVVSGVVVIADTGDEDTSRLLAYMALTPFTTDGTDIVLTWDTGGIFEL